MDLQQRAGDEVRDGRPRMHRGVLAAFALATAGVAVALQLPAIHGIATALSTGEVPFTLLTEAEIAATSTTDGPRLVSATYQQASIIASGLSPTASGFLLAGHSAGVLAAIAVAASVVWFVCLLLWRRPFHRSLVAASSTAGFALLVGGLLSTGLGGLGRMMAADELNPLVGDVFFVGFGFDPVVWVVGALVLALSFVFQRGTSLEHDTQGLV